MSSLDRRLPPGFLAEALRADAQAGLSADPKSLPPKWFYDAQGSALFEKITELREYYPTRAEREILRTHAGSIAALTQARTLVELGSGSSEKTRLLLDALRAEGTLRCYVPVDVSEAALAGAAAALTAEYPGLDVRAVVSDFEQHLGFPDGDGAPSPGWSPSWAAPSGTCCRSSGPRSCTGSGPSCVQATSSCWARTWSRTRPRWSPRMTTTRGSPPSSTRTSWPC